MTAKDTKAQTMSRVETGSSRLWEDRRTSMGRARRGT
jgi:hypothetical protein